MSSTNLGTVGSDGKLDKRLVPGSAVPQHTEWSFGGSLTVRPGVQFWMTHPFLIKPTRFSTQVGSVGIGGSGVQIQLMTQGNPICTLVHSPLNRSAKTTAFSLTEIPAETLLSVDILALGGATTPPADLIAELLWEAV